MQHLSATTLRHVREFLAQTDEAFKGITLAWLRKAIKDGRHGGTAARVAKNIIRSRIARASHGKPTAEPLERTALRLLKRAGRPELSERYARIRRHIAATRGNA